MPAGKPPFRADHVGSLLRPAEVHDARVKHAEGRLGDIELKAIEDRAIEAAIARQEAIGLQGVTDGEMRRATWHMDFLSRLDGVETIEGEAVSFQGALPHKTRIMHVTGKLGFSGHPMLDHFAFLKRHTHRTPKMTIPSPTMLVSPSRDWRETVDRGLYPDLESLFGDLGRAYAQAVNAFGEAGCRYLQLDDCSLAFACDPATRKKMSDRGDDPDRVLDLWVDVINTALAARPPEMTITTHVCRGNFRSTWLTQGGYEPIAEALFGRIDFDGYFLEYDTERAGGFEPLRFLPKRGDKRVVLGLITTKTGALESVEEVTRRIDRAADHVDLDRLCLSPQCGFASTEEGNLLSEDEQWAKLEEVVRIADSVWGGVAA